MKSVQDETEKVKTWHSSTFELCYIILIQRHSKECILTFSLQKHLTKSSLCADWHIPPCLSQRTLLTFYSAPSQLTPSATKFRGTKHPHWEKKEKWREWHTLFLGSKAIFLPSALIHSLCVTLVPGGIGVACHWCHSPVSQSVTGSDGLHVVERKPPAKRHIGWSHHLFMLTTKPKTQNIWSVYKIWYCTFL